MNRKQFVILLIVVLVVGAGGLLVYRQNNRSWENPGTTLGGRLLPGLAINDIAEIIIKGRTNELHLARQDNLWRVRERGNYPANFSQISDWLIKLSDMKIAQSQEIGASQLSRFDLLPTGPGEHTATSVTFMDATGKTLAALLIGKTHMKKPTGQQPPGMGDQGWPDGRYVMVGNDTTTLDVVADPLENAEPKPEAWLNKDFLTIDRPDEIAVRYPVATNSWKLTRASETNDWTLAEAQPKEKLDDAKVSGVTTPFSSPTFNDVLPLDTDATISGMTNITMATVRTLDGFTYAAQIGQKQADNYPVTFTVAANFPAPSGKVADQTKSGTQKTLTDKLAREQAYQHWIYLMPSYAVDPLLKNRADLLVTETNAAPTVTGTNSLPTARMANEAGWSNGLRGGLMAKHPNGVARFGIWSNFSCQ